MSMSLAVSRKCSTHEVRGAGPSLRVSRTRRSCAPIQVACPKAQKLLGVEPTSAHGRRDIYADGEDDG